ncbi:MAG: sugar phosphate nucleotidyltransferase [Methanobacteriota archaeon]
MRAVILAAGEGLRLKPLTSRKPKVMIKVGGKPMLEHVVEALVHSGVTDITLVVGYRRERVQSHFEDGKRFGARIRYAFQDALLGTAHALAQADFEGDDLLVLSGDNVIDAQLVKDLIRSPSGIAVAVQRSENPSKYGVVELSGPRIVGLAEKPSEVRSDLVSTGFYYFPKEFAPKIVSYVKQGVNSLAAILENELSLRTEVRGVQGKGVWMDAVYPWDLLRLNFEVLRRGQGVVKGSRTTIRDTVAAQSPVAVGEGSLVEHHAVLGPGVAIGENVTIGAGAVLENCMILDDTQVEPGAIVKNAIIGEGCFLGPRFLALSGACEVKSEDGYHRLSNFGCVIGEDVRIGGNVVIEPGVTVGNGTRIASHVVLRRSVEDGAVVV